MHGHHGMWRRALDLEDVQLPKDLPGRVWRFARPYRRRITGYLGMVALTALFTASQPLLYRAVIDHALRERRIGLLNVLALSILLVATGGALAQVGARWLSSRIGESVIFDLRVCLFEKVHRLPIAFFTRTQTGALISRLTSDVIGAQRPFTETLGQLGQTVVGLTVTLAIMLSLEWRLTLMALAIAPVFLFVTRKMGKRLQALLRKQMDVNAAINSQMTERFQVGGALLVKLFGNRRSELDTFGRRAGMLRDIGVQMTVYTRAFFVAFGLVAAIGTGLVYWFGGRQVIAGDLSLGTIVAFAVYLTQLYQPITQLSNARLEITLALVSFQRVFEVLDFPVAIDERPGAVELVEPKGRVELDGVWFRYPPPSEVSIASLEGEESDRGYDEGAWAVRGVSFAVEPGQTVALVGPSGAGKTTISMLVPRLYEATRGSVCIDGVDVRDLTMESLAAAIGMVPQDPHLFHDTVRNNLLYARPGATEREMVEAARAAQIHDLIATLPDGYDTMVGERGYRFSGGEKQRVAIARLLLKDPAIMILDEATSHLDSESESLIQRALAIALSGRSSLVIAHRLSTVVRADLILVLDRGRIVQRGTHEELLAAGGLYEALYRIQFGRAAEVPLVP